MANSQLSNTEALIEGIAAAIQTAWTDCVDKVHVGMVMEDTNTPYAHIILESVGMEYMSVRTVEQRHRFVITRVAATTAGARLMDEKITKANLLLAQLMASATFATYGFSPIVSNVDLEATPSYLKDSEYAIAITFEVSVEADTIGAV